MPLGGGFREGHDGTRRVGGGQNSQDRKAWQSGDPNGALRNLKGLGRGCGGVWKEGI